MAAVDLDSLSDGFARRIGSAPELVVRAPGGDLMCGRAAAYDLAFSRRPITPESFAGARPLPVGLVPAAAGTAQSLKLPSGPGWVALRAVDAAGNVGLPLVVALPVTHARHHGRR